MKQMNAQQTALLTSAIDSLASQLESLTVTVRHLQTIIEGAVPEEPPEAGESTGGSSSSVVYYCVVRPGPNGAAGPYKTKRAYAAAVQAEGAVYSGRRGEGIAFSRESSSHAFRGQGALARAEEWYKDLCDGEVPVRHW